MAFYQTFPREPGASNSMEKLARLAIPPLAAKSFLDVGCNTGYFCGYAFFEGASKVVGIDRDAASLELARNRFPQCAFIEGDWENMAELLNDACFDVILCSSALHYAKNQRELLNKIMERLKTDGTLVLEVGVAADTQTWPEIKSGWHLVKRSIDERLFPSMKGLQNLLSPWAYKIMGKSVSQLGDPVGRIVVHARKPKKMAIILIGASGSGKSEVARKLGDKIKIIQGDYLLLDILREPLKFGFENRAPAREVNSQRLDWEILKLFNAGEGKIFAKAVALQADNQDFIYDGFIPRQYREIFKESLVAEGFRVIEINLPAPEYLPMELGSRARQEARKYEMFLTALAGNRRKC